MRVDSLVDDTAQITLDQGRWLLPAHVVEARHAERAQLEHVAESLGGDKADARALVLEDRIRRDGGAVANFVDGLTTETAFSKDLRQAFDDGRGVIANAR